MSGSKRLFNSHKGFYSVFSCACGCDGAVEVTFGMQQDAVRERFYIRSHQPLGTATEYIGRRYDFEASSEALEDDFDLGVAQVPFDEKSQTREPPGPFNDEWGEVTPTEALEWWLNDEEE